MVKAAKQTILRIAFLKGMGESEFFVPSCGQGFYGLNAGIVKGQGTQAKHIKRERESVCVSLTALLLCTRPECFSWFCVKLCFVPLFYSGVEDFFLCKCTLKKPKG